MSTIINAGMPLVGETRPIIDAALLATAQERDLIRRCNETFAQLAADILAIGQEIATAKTAGLATDALVTKIKPYEQSLVSCQNIIQQAQSVVDDYMNTPAVARAQAVRYLTEPAIRQVNELSQAPSGILDIVGAYL